MSERTVLVIAYYFPPMGLSGVMRTVRFVKYLALNNWKPIVLTSTPAHYHSYDETLLEEFEGLDIEVIRTPPKKKRFGGKSDDSKAVKLLNGAASGISSFLHQPDSAIRWRKTALETAENIIREKKINVIFTTAPPFSDFIIAEEIAKKHRIPFIVDYRDLWVDNPERSYPTPMHKNSDRQREETILKTASHVLVTSRAAKELLIKRYRFLRYDDVGIIPDSYDGEYFDEYYPHSGDHKLIITHCGEIQKPQLTKKLIQAIGKFLKKNPQLTSILEFRFVGTLAGLQQKKIEKLGLQQNIICTGSVSHRDAMKQMLAADILLLVSDRQQPSAKLYEYLGARKPILACVNSSVAKKAAEETGAAIIARADNAKDIEQKIEAIVSEWKNGSLSLPDESTVLKHDIRNHIGELSRLLAIAARF